MTASRSATTRRSRSAASPFRATSSVIGYDDEEIARHLTPPLTTLVLPHREMGRWAVEKALSPAAHAKQPITKLECPLIARASVRDLG